MVRVFRVRRVIKDTYGFREKLYDIIDFVVDGVAKVINFIGNIDRVPVIVFSYFLRRAVCMGYVKGEDEDTIYYIIGDDVFSIDIPNNISLAVCFQKRDGKEYRVLYRFGELKEVYVMEGKEWKKVNLDG